jgi:hypothetical protein
LGQGLARDDKKGAPRSLGEEATALGVQPKHGWVTTERVKVQPLFAKGDEAVRLVLRFKPDTEAIGKGKATGMVTLGWENSEEGQAEVITQPAEGIYELLETKEGRVLQITQMGVPDKKDVFKKVDKVEFKVSYELKDGKLTFPKGLDTDYWSAWPAAVKRKEAVIFEAK